VGNLPSHPPVVKVLDVALQVHKIVAGPDEEGVEPGREQFDRDFLAMPHRVSLCVQINNVRGLIRALSVVVAGNPTVLQPLDPFGGVENSIADGDVKVGYSPVVLDITIGGSVECVLIVPDMVVEPMDLLPEVADFAGLLGVASSDGCEEPFSDGLENVCIEVRVGCQGGCNSTRQHRWFQTLDWSDQERDAVFGR
jgi:hypothetical protein